MYIFIISRVIFLQPCINVSLYLKIYSCIFWPRFVSGLLPVLNNNVIIRLHLTSVQTYLSSSRLRVCTGLCIIDGGSASPGLCHGCAVGTRHRAPSITLKSLQAWRERRKEGSSTTKSAFLVRFELSLMYYSISAIQRKPVCGNTSLQILPGRKWMTSVCRHTDYYSRPSVGSWPLTSKGQSWPLATWSLSTSLFPSSNHWKNPDLKMTAGTGSRRSSWVYCIRRYSTVWLFR